MPLVVVALLSASCASKEPVVPARYAVLRFENLTADPAWNWMGRAASEIVAREIGAIPSSVIYKAAESFGRRPVGAPGVSTEFQDALLAGANRVVTGYLELNHGRLTFTAVEEDSKTGKTVFAATVEGSLLAACSELAKRIEPSSKPYPARNESAIQSYALALESNGNDVSLYEEAIKAEPSFPDPYIAAAEASVARGDVANVARLLNLARDRKLDALTMAKLELALATANNDRAARTAALKRLLAAEPKDPTAIQALAESQFAERKFTEAAATYAKAASASRPDLLNLEAYALMFGGDEKAALSAVGEYQNARPKDANTFDSEGDIQFFFGHFAEAEKAYLQASSIDAKFNEGAETWKAARARLMTGDVNGATQLFGRYKEVRTKEKDPGLPFRDAYWRFVSGDRAGALAKMRELGQAPLNDALKTLALTQCAIWELSMGRQPDAIKDSDAVLKAGPSPSLLSAALVRFATQDFNTANDLDVRARLFFNAPATVALRPFAVGYALYVRKKYADAAAAWKRVYDESNANDQSNSFLYAAALQQSGRASEAAPILKYNPLPVTDLAPNWECFYFPQLFDWRGDHATFLKLSGGTPAPAK